MSLWINYLDQILLYAALALSLNLLLGYAGQVSVAHAAFGAIGGYTMAYTTQAHGWNFLLGTAARHGAGVRHRHARRPAGAQADRRVPHPADARRVVGDPRAARRLPDFGGTYGLINLPPANLFGWHLQRAARTGCCRRSWRW